MRSNEEKIKQEAIAKQLEEEKKINAEIAKRVAEKKSVKENDATEEQSENPEADAEVTEA